MAKFDETKPYIFISYAHKDSARVKDIMGRLRNEGYNIWYDGGIDPGTEWDENIASHIKNCSYFIAFISANYIASKNCKDELNYARDLDKSQLMLYLEDVSLPDGMAMRMNRIQAIWWDRYKNPEEAFKKLFTAKGINIANTNLVVQTSMEEIGDVSGGPITTGVPGGNGQGYVVYREPKRGVPIWVFVLSGLLLILIVLVLILLLSGGAGSSDKKGNGSTDYTGEADEGSDNKNGSDDDNGGQESSLLPKIDKASRVYESPYGDVKVSYPEQICDFYTKDDSLYVRVSEVVVRGGDLVVNFKLMANDNKKDSITIAGCLLSDSGFTNRDLYRFDIKDAVAGESIVSLTVRVPNGKIGTIKELEFYSMQGGDVLYSQIIDNKAKPGATIQILQEYTSGSDEDSEVRMVLGNFKTEKVEGNPDYVYLIASGVCVENKSGAGVWYNELECFDASGNPLLSGKGNNGYKIGFASPGYYDGESGEAVIPIGAQNYLTPDEFDTNLSGSKVLIPSNTAIVNVRTY